MVYPPPQGAVGGAPAVPYPNGGLPFNVEKNLIDEGPPPYFPPDMASPASAHQPPPQQPAVQPTDPAIVNPPPEVKPNNEDIKTVSGGIPDLPDLPGVPDDTPSREDTPGGGKDDEEDIDFDDLTRRFEALKKKK